MSRPRDEAGAADRSGMRHALPRLVLGAGIAAAGVLFTLDNIGVVDADEWLHWWPVLLVAFGAGLLLAGGTPSERIGGGIWFGIGSWLLADDILDLPFSLFDFWPLALVAAGALLVMRAVRPGGGWWRPTRKAACTPSR